METNDLVIVEGWRGAVRQAKPEPDPPAIAAHPRIPERVLVVSRRLTERSREQVAA